MVRMGRLRLTVTYLMYVKYITRAYGNQIGGPDNVVLVVLRYITLVCYL